MATLSSILKRDKQSQIIKCRNRHILGVVCKADIIAVELFPKNNLAHNSELARTTVSRILEIPYEKEVGEDYNKEIEEIHRSLISEEWTKKVIANYYRLEELFYSHEKGSGELFSQKIEDYRKKAKSYYSVSQSIFLNEVDSIDKNIKKDIKELSKNLKRLRSERIETEKHKIIEPIDLSLFQVLTLFSLFSILSLIGAYIHNRLLLGAFNINPSDFFLLYDYISSSADVIESSFIALTIAAIVYFVGVNSSLSNIAQAQQFNIVDQSSNRFSRFLIAIVIIPILGLVLQLVINQELPENTLHYLYTPMFIGVLYFIFYKVPWGYMKNPYATSITIAILFTLLTNLIWGVRNDIRDIRNGEYESPYIISFEDDYKQYSKHIFLLSNSNYVFLVDEESKEISVIPKSGVKAIFSKRNENHDWLLK